MASVNIIAGITFVLLFIVVCLAIFAARNFKRSYLLQLKRNVELKKQIKGLNNRLQRLQCDVVAALYNYVKCSNLESAVALENHAIRELLKGDVTISSDRGKIVIESAGRTLEVVHKANRRSLEPFI